MRDRHNHAMHGTDYLHRARLALRVLSGSGLGDLNWVGPNWICALGEIDPRTLHFLSIRIKQDARLRQEVRHSRSRRELRRLQERAISQALEEYAKVTGQQRVSVPLGNPDDFATARAVEKKAPFLPRH
jgi:hypothetical protein